jgi:hypothetical protein
MYLVDAIGRASEVLEDWRPTSAFYYYGSAIENGIDWIHFVSITLIALALVLLAALAFRRRDIYVAFQHFSMSAFQEGRGDSYRRSQKRLFL